VEALIKVLIYIGDKTGQFIIIGVWAFLLMMIELEWQCGLCGRTNITNLFMYLFQMCDHEGI